ncbi:MAG: hypothetical protein MJ153_03555 [Clostridia bacterium]|nr:hypothetical protein [Clostridia bacterium]
MKRTLVSVLSISLLLSIASCSGSTDETTAVSTTEAVTVATTVATEPEGPTVVPVDGAYELFDEETMFEVVEEATVYSDCSLTEVVTTLPEGGMVVCIATHGQYIVTDSGYYIFNTALKEFQAQ